MKRLVMFMVLAALGTAVLFHFAGGIEGPQQARQKPVVQVHEREPARTGGHFLPTGDGRKITDLQGFVQEGELGWATRTIGANICTGVSPYLHQLEAQRDLSKLTSVRSVV